MEGTLHSIFIYATGSRRRHFSALADLCTCEFDGDASRVARKEEDDVGHSVLEALQDEGSGDPNPPNLVLHLQRLVGLNPPRPFLCAWT